MNDCPRIGKLFGGCKFSPRYDKIAPTPAQLKELTFHFSEDYEGITGRRYICDVCERCGKTLFKRKPDAVKP